MSMLAAFSILFTVTGFYAALSLYLVYRLVSGYLSHRPQQVRS